MSFNLNSNQEYYHIGNIIFYIGISFQIVHIN